MLRLIILLSFITGCINIDSAAQDIDMAAYNGMWKSQMHPIALSHELSLKQITDNRWEVRLTNNTEFYKKEITSKGKGLLLDLGEGIRFRGVISQDKRRISGFINSPDYEYHIDLIKEGTIYKGRWNTFYIDQISPAELYLAIENGEGDIYQAYPLILDDRFRGTYAYNFTKENNRISFKDDRTGYAFEGELQDDKIALHLLLAGQRVTTLNFTRTTEDLTFETTAQSNTQNINAPIQINDGLKTGILSNHTTNRSGLDKMVDDIASNELTFVHSVLVAKEGALIYENYFNGFHKDLPHDQRSAAKSIGSAITGIALEEGIIKNVDDPIYDYLPKSYLNHDDPEKSKITIHDLLTMSSGLDAIDFGIDRMGEATEDAYQNSDDWLKTVLDAPMIFKAGEHCNYGSANPYLISAALSNTLSEPLLEYMQERLLDPLEMSNYSISLDDKGDPYFGGGFYLIPRDMIKFGELYRNGGIWNGKRIISEEWVNKSFQKYAYLENTEVKNKYGYLWWHYDYEVGGKKIAAVEARGAGGQYISVIKELDMTIVITSGNYRNGRFAQPEQIIRDYILPSFIKK